MPIVVRHLALFTILALICATPLSAQRRDRNRITQEEILKETSQSMTFEIVKVLRPQWFRDSAARRMSGSGTSATAPGIVLYIDGVRQDNLVLMNQVSPGRVKEVRYLAPRDAHLRFGMGHEAGVIEVTTVKLPGGW